MTLRRARRWPAVLAAGLLSFAPWISMAPSAEAGARSRDPAAIIPIDQIAPAQRASVVETIRDYTFHRQGTPDSFPCNPKLYLSLLNEPSITLALWKDLSESPVRLRQVSPNLYTGTDGAGATATWEYVLRSPKLHVLLSKLDYVGPRGNVQLQGRIVLVVRSGYYKEVNGEHWVQHDIEAFVKIDSKGWKTVARTVRPIIEKLLEDQVHEAGLFVSLMGRLVETYPDWARQVAMAKADVTVETRQRFCEVVQQARRPGASPGRPTMLAESAADTPRRR